MDFLFQFGDFESADAEEKTKERLWTFLLPEAYRRYQNYVQLIHRNSQKDVFFALRVEDTREEAKSENFLLAFQPR